MNSANNFSIFAQPKDLGRLDSGSHNWLIHRQVFSGWHSRRLVEQVKVVGVGLYSIFELRLGTLAIACGLLCWRHRHLSLKILALLESAKIPRQLFHQVFLEWD